MKLGMPSLIEYATLEENMVLCQELGLDFVELNMNLPMFDSAMDLGSAKNLMNRYGVELTLHVNESADVGALDPVLREGYQKHVMTAIDIAKALDIKLINMHLSIGIHFKLPSKAVFLYEKYEAVYLEHIRSFRERVEEAIGDAGILICVENTGIHDKGFIKKCTDLLLESDCFGLTYDIGHDIASGYKDKAYYKNRMDEISHFHIHDGTAKKNHLELFTGELEILTFIDLAVKNKARCVIEVKESGSLRRSIEKLRLKRTT